MAAGNGNGRRGVTETLARETLRTAVAERAVRNDAEHAGTGEIVQVRRHALDEYLSAPDRMDSIIRSLSGSGIDPERFVRSIVTLVTTNPALAEALPPAAPEDMVRTFNRSVMVCALQIAALALDPSPALGHVWVVPFKSWKKEDGQFKVKGVLAQLLVGYQGYVVLASRAGWTVQVGPIWAGQDFVYNEFDPAGSRLGVLERVPAPDEVPRYVYYLAVEKLTGARRLVVRPYEHYLRARERSQSWQQDARKSRDERGKRGALSSPWSTDELAMVFKTAVRWERKLTPMGDSLTVDAARFAFAHAVDGTAGVALPSGRPDGLNDTGTALWQPTAADFPDQDSADPGDGAGVDWRAVNDAELVARLRACAFGAEVGEDGWDVTADLDSLISSHGLDPDTVWPVVRGEEEGTLPARPVLIAMVGLCEQAASR